MSIVIDYTKGFFEAAPSGETVGDIATGTLDLTTGNVFSDAPATAATYVFSNPPATGTAYGFTLKVTPSATVTVTWPVSVTWAGGTAPTAPASGETDVYAFYTQDGGTTYYGFQAGDAILASYGIYHVMPETQPEYDPLVQTLVRDPEPNNNETAVNEDTGETYKTGRWVIGYTVENKPQDQAETAVRNKRDRLLAETDWMALSDVTMGAGTTTYRQALRDITEQAGFPYTVVWPTSP